MATKKRSPDIQVHAEVTPTPSWKHDCPRCRFRGRIDGRDIYQCSGPTGLSIVARYGDEPSETLSLPHSLFAGDAIATALLGLLFDDNYHRPRNQFGAASTISLYGWT